MLVLLVTSLAAAPSVAIGTGTRATTLEVAAVGKQPDAPVSTQLVMLVDVISPKWPQRGSAEATQFCRDLTLGEQVTLEARKPDEVLSRLGEADEVSSWARVKVGKAWLHEALLEAGWAWVAPAKRTDAALMKLEKEAREARRGLWADEAPVEPWTWREQLLLRDQETGVFHEGWSCPHVQATRCRACGGGRFGSAAEAVDAGFAPHACLTPELLRFAEAQGPLQPAQALRRDEGAPRLPQSARRACSGDADCALAPPVPCTCPGCGAVWRTPVRKDVGQRMQSNFARVTCGSVGCPACATREAGTKAVCRDAQCVVVP
ncbi:MAG: thermonuclease family protein [Myxococcaceae bacterium]|nr:thermonuclease family protein [Myxococcaceae bacterium]